MQVTEERVAKEKVSMADAKSSLEEIVERVAANGDGVIIELDGKPQAAIVPVAAYLEWRQQRKQEAFDRIREIAKRVNMTEEEAEELIEEAKEAVRSGKSA